MTDRADRAAEDQAAATAAVADATHEIANATRGRTDVGHAEATAAVAAAVAANSVSVASLGRIEGTLDALADSLKDVARTMEAFHRSSRAHVTWIKINVAALVLFAVLSLLGQRSIRAQGRYVVECTTAGPHAPTGKEPGTGHACYDRGQAGQVDAILQLDCLTVAAARFPAPAMCGDIDARLRAAGFIP